MSSMEGDIWVKLLAREHLFPVGFSSARTEGHQGQRFKTEEKLRTCRRFPPDPSCVRGNRAERCSERVVRVTVCARRDEFSEEPRARGAPPACSSWSCGKTFRLPLEGLRAQPSHSGVEELPARYRTARECGRAAARVRGYVNERAREPLPEQSEAGFSAPPRGGQLRGFTSVLRGGEGGQVCGSSSRTDAVPGAELRLQQRGLIAARSWHLEKRRPWCSLLLSASSSCTEREEEEEEYGGSELCGGKEITWGGWREKRPANVLLTDRLRSIIYTPHRYAHAHARTPKQNGGYRNKTGGLQLLLCCYQRKITPCSRYEWRFLCSQGCACSLGGPRAAEGAPSAPDHISEELQKKKSPRITSGGA